MHSSLSLRQIVSLVSATALMAGVALVVGCSSDAGGEKKGGDGASFGVKLRRVEVAGGGFGELNLEVIALVTNPGSEDLVISGGDIEVGFAGRPERLADQVGDGMDDEGSEEEDGEGDEADEADDGDEADASADEEGSDGEGGAALESQVEAATSVDLSTEGITDLKATGSTNGGRVPAGAEAELPYTVTLPMPADPEALARLLSWEIADVAVSGTVQAGGATESFEGTREVRLPLLPMIKLDAQVGRVDGGREGEVFFHMAIYNPNGFELEIEKVAYVITIAGKQMLERPGEPDAIPAGAERPYDESVKLNTETYGADVNTMLRQPAVPFTLEGMVVVKGIEVPIKFGGAMEFPR